MEDNVPVNCDEVRSRMYSECTGGGSGAGVCVVVSAVARGRSALCTLKVRFHKHNTASPPTHCSTSPPAALRLLAAATPDRAFTYTPNYYPSTNSTMREVISLNGE